MLQGFFEPALQFLVEQDPLQWRKNRDWQQETHRFDRPNFSYPDYYENQNFHSIQDGYLSVEAALSYDFISQYLLLPNETVIRQELINTVQEQPQRILDLGCGTGSTTLMLQQAFPQAEVVGLDLSPYMLVVADNKAQQAELNIQFLQGSAERTEFSDRSFDLITASLLFHEIPSLIATTILQESYRLLKTGGEIAILDGNQPLLRYTGWLKSLFEEPYIADYAKGDMTVWMKLAGFITVQTHSVWWMQQVSHGIKP